MSSLVTPALIYQLTEQSQTRAVQTNTNLDFNAALIDCEFTCPASYENRWEFLKDVYLQIMLRLGSENGGSIPLISDVPLYSLLELSDYEAGVSMQSTVFGENKKVRISGKIRLGFYSMDARDALEVTLAVSDKSKIPAASPIDIKISTVYEKVEKNSFILYKNSRPTGADQPYKNVLKMFYSGEQIVNESVTLTDQLGSESINIEDAIALSNAEGQFEFFTRFGKIYEDEYGLSQDLAFRCPTTDPNARILVQQYGFYPSAMSGTEAITDANYNSLLEKIRTQDSEKYNYLANLGIVQ